MMRNQLLRILSFCFLITLAAAQGGSKNKQPKPPEVPITPPPTFAPTKAPNVVAPTSANPPTIRFVTRDLGSFQVIFKAKSESTTLEIDRVKMNAVAETTFTDHITSSAEKTIKDSYVSSSFNSEEVANSSIRFRRLEDTASSEARFELTGAATFMEKGAPSEDEAKNLLLDAFSDGSKYVSALVADGAYTGDVDVLVEYPENERIGGGKGNVGGTVGGVIAAAAFVSLAVFGFVKYKKRKTIDDVPYKMPEMIIEEGESTFEIMSPEDKRSNDISSSYDLTPQLSTAYSIQDRNASFLKGQVQDDDFSFDGSAALGNGETTGDKVLGQVLAMSSYDPVNTSDWSEDASTMQVDDKIAAYTLGYENTMEKDESDNEGHGVEIQFDESLSKVNKTTSAAVAPKAKINFYGSARVVQTEKSSEQGPTFVHVSKPTMEYPVQMARSSEAPAHYYTEADADSDDGSYSSYVSSDEEIDIFDGIANVSQFEREKEPTVTSRSKQPIPPSSLQEVDEYSLRPKPITNNEDPNSRPPVSSLRNPTVQAERQTGVQQAIKAQGVSTTNYAASARRTRLEQQRARAAGARSTTKSSRVNDEPLSSQVANLRKARLQQMKR
jgi:hypothetical protein